MNDSTKSAAQWIRAGQLPPVRSDFVPKEHYTSPEFTKLENERLWPRVWQIACRAEEIPQVGRFVTYRINQQSVIVVRTGADRIQAFHNVCPHRGRELKAGSGGITKFQCPFHGWQWDLQGRNTRIPDRSDWDGCARMSGEDIDLMEIKVGIWGGWVFINMDPECESFADFIDPVPQFLGCLEFETMRYAWHKTFVLQANWKTAMESFMESYHLPITHPQALPLVDHPNWGSAHGKHGKHTYYWERPPGAPSRLVNAPMPEDWRKAIIALYEWNAVEVGGTHRNGHTSDRATKAVLRLMDELPADAPYLDVITKAMQLSKEAAEAEGAGWPTVTPEQAANLGADWNIFPNMVLVFSYDSTLVIQARSNGDDPHSCVFNLSAITRFAPGQEPKVEWEQYGTWQENVHKIPHLLTQDLSNIEAVQRGMRSIAFKGSRPNPKQEVQMTHHHQILRQYLFG